MSSPQENDIIVNTPKDLMENTSYKSPNNQIEFIYVDLNYQECNTYQTLGISFIVRDF